MITLKEYKRRLALLDVLAERVSQAHGDFSVALDRRDGDAAVRLLDEIASRARALTGAVESFFQTNFRCAGVPGRGSLRGRDGAAVAAAEEGQASQSVNDGAPR